MHLERRESALKQRINSTIRKGPINHFDPVAAETIKFLGSVARVSDRSRDDVGDDEISFLGTARWRHETTRGALVLSLVTGRC